ncbi:substrate-binding periplasmic protein [Pigmentibacter ruber]|uniref:substrate-binding periplasmic protein n=1 Tax=Pigmentibacter ruber TaxID=2683196 RepID=UPI00131BDDB8|nr:ABC transporter substrate-binding protein [Pigmentibacter ruber]BFD30424.1 ABC transporter substrate-binding protein [Pigmentibacter ruber]
MKKSIFKYLVCFILLLDNKGFPSTTVKVGGYTFPPYVDQHNPSAKQTGITIELINEMNKIQNDYKFEFVPTSSGRRYIDYKSNQFDMVFFEDIVWGWKDYDVISSELLTKDEEVYITKKKEGRDQSYFNDKKNKKFVGIKGYHYAFASYNNDIDFLKKNFRAELTSDHDGSIQMILYDRGDIGIVTHSYLDFYLNKNPDVKDKIIISNKPDQIYNLGIIARKNMDPKIEVVNKIIQKLKSSGALKKLFKQYNLKEI